MEPKFRKTEIPLMDIPDDVNMSGMNISAAASAMVDKAMEEETTAMQHEVRLPYEQRPPGNLDQVASVLCDISTTLDDPTLCGLMEERAREGRYKMSIGSTNVIDNMYIT